MRRLILPGLILAALAAAFVVALRPIGSFAGDDDKPASKSKSGPRVYKGRVIAPVMTAAGGGAEWLERPDRDETEQPDKVIEALKIAPGSVVADVGAGTGYFSIRIAKKIGPEGKVLATDVQPEMLRQLTENMKKAGVKNIDRILATANDAKLPANKVDLVLMVDVYHELQDPERTMAQIRKSLKDDGRLVLVEYRGEDPDVPIKPEHKTTLRQIRYEIEPMGFRLKEVFEFLVHQHVEVFVKDDVKGEVEIIDPNDFPMIRKPGWAGVGTSAPYEKAGFISLFSGSDLAGWNGEPESWQVRDGVLSGRVYGKNSSRRTDELFDDFELDLQWRLKDDNWASVRITATPSGTLRTPSGLETQPLQEFTVRLQSGVPHATGYPDLLAAAHNGQVLNNIIEIVPPSDTSKALVLPNDWNRLTVRCKGSRALIAINGVKTSEFGLAERNRRRSVILLPGKEWSQFREIWIKRLDEK